MPTFRDDPKLGCMVPMMKTDDINDQAITKDKIRDGNVTTEKLADGAVSTDKLPDGVIKTSKIADENITTEKLAEGAVETSKIADQNVTSEKIADQSVDNSKLYPEAVTYDKVKDKAIITEKLNDRAVTTEKVEERAITNPKLGNQSVDGRVVREACLETKHFANESVTTEKIKDGSVTNEKVADDTLGIEKFDPELRKTIQAATGLPEDLSQMIQNVDQSVKQLKEKDTDLQSQINDKQQQITANDDDISLLQTRSTQMEKAIKSISASGGASQASAVTYENTESGLDSVTAQGAIDELANKKFNKENIAQEFGDSEDKVVSQSALPFRYIQNEEFIFAKVDAEDKLLFGIQWDGTPKFGKTSEVEDILQSQVTLLAEKVATILGDGDTTNVIDTMNELKKFFADIEDTETLAGILANLDNVSKNLDKTTIKDEEGNVLDTPFRVISNEEFINAIVDAEDKVLFGFYRATGKPYYPLNETYHVIQNEEYFAAWITTDDKVVLGLRRDGEIIGEIHAVNALKKVISQLQSDLTSLQEKVGTIDTDLKELLDVFFLQENPEYMAVETDTEGKILSATNADGSHYIHNAKSETIPTEFEHFEDPEGRMEVTTDAEERVMSYRDLNGKKHEHSMEVTNLEVSKLNLQGNSVNDIQDALKANGFDAKTPTDLSDSNFIQIPEPRFAIINILNIDSMPTTKQDNKKAFLQFWDMHGNYFNKHAILNAQGSSSMAYVKKNVAIDFCDDEWIGDDTPKIRFGDWVPQDSFHMKAYYTDFFRGVGAVSYKLYDQIVRTRGNMYDRPWKKALLDMLKIGTTTKSLGNPYVGDYDFLTDTGARCFPDGFPVAVYLNDKFYGIFSFQLKKHRDNYHLDKATAEHVHLDGVLNTATIFNGKDNIDWSQFEIRNPKNLYAIGGNKYDADTKQEEIAGENEVNTWITNGQLPNGTEISPKIKKNLQMTAKVKKYIQDFADILPALKNAMTIYEGSSKTEDDLNTFKAVYEKYFDKENMIDYMILSDLVKNADGFSKNWQWFTYDGKKWWVGLYDCDMSFGGDWEGYRITDVLTEHLNSSTSLPNGFVVKYYSDELTKRYKYLADLGVASSRNIFSLLKEWCMRIGTNFFKEEYKKWADSPCISDSIVRDDYWELIVDDKGNPQMDTSETFNATISYNIGEVVSFGINDSMGYFKFKCIKATEALSKNTPHTVSTYSPVKVFKHCDNIYRVQKWIEKNTENMDKLYNYTRI